MKIVLWNIYGLTSTESLKSTCSNADVIVLTETWLKPGAICPELDGYVSFNSNKTVLNVKARRGSGGVAIYVKKKYADHVSVWKSSLNGTKLWIKLDKQVGLEKDMFIAGCYFPPANSTCYQDPDFMDLFEDLADDIACISALGIPIVGGDFNARTNTVSDISTTSADVDDLLSMNNIPIATDKDALLGLGSRNNLDMIKDNSFGKKLIDLCIGCRLYILNGRTVGDEAGNFTCFPKSGGSSVVDYFMAPPELSGKFLSLTVLDKTLESDHCPIVLIFSAPRVSPVGSDAHCILNSEPVIRYMPNNKKILAYQGVFQNDTGVKQKLEHAQDMNTDVKNSIDALHQSIFCALSKTYKMQKKSQSGPNSFPKNDWFDAECKEMNKRFKAAMRSGAEHVTLQLQSEYRRLTRRKKRAFNKYKAAKIADLAKSNPRKFWQMYKIKAKQPAITDKGQWKDSFEALLNVALDDAGSLQSDGLVGNLQDSSQNTDRESSLSAPIVPSEVEAAIKTLKRNKSSDLEGMRAEYIKDAIEQLCVPVAAVFQKIFDTNYPKDWPAGMICPIFKSGDPADCSNYRGITVGNILGKLYATVLERRISKWAEQKGIRAKGQAGFRKDHRTLDNIFILRNLIDTAKASNHQSERQLYVCFVDFKKAFDTVPRDLLWERLREIGIQGTMLNAIISMYKDVTACVKTPSGVTDFFPCTLGVKQGCPLSPSLFGLYIDSLEGVLLQENSRVDAPVLLGTNPGTKVPLLLYADDIALISTTKEGLQNSLALLGDFCKAKKLTVNLKKTQVVVFNDPRSSKAIKKKESFLYKGEPLEIVDTYTYLGVVFERGGKWTCTKSNNIKAMRKALFAMMHRIQDLRIQAPYLLCSLFDTLIAPVVSYGCEMWAADLFRDSVYLEEAEAIHRAFLRRIIHVRKSVPNEVLLAELGRLPLKFQWQNLIIRYFNRLVKMPEGRLLKSAFVANVILDSRGASCWSRSIRLWATPRINQKPDRSQYLNYSRPLEDPLFETIVPQIEGHLLQNWPRELEEFDFWSVAHRDYFTKLHSRETKIQSHVSLFRYGSDGLIDISPAPYLTGIESGPVRTALARFRTSSHNLAIETGRWVKPDKILQENRKCTCCSLDKVEDEVHFVFDCPLYYQIRGEFYSDLFADNNRDMRSLFTIEKLSATGQFIKRCFDLRDSHLG